MRVSESGLSIIASAALFQIPDSLGILIVNVSDVILCEALRER